MDKLKKFLRKLDPRRREKVAAAIEAIEANRLVTLDIKPLQGLEGHFRCRIGNIRILFYHHGGKNIIYDANFRGQVYR